MKNTNTILISVVILLSTALLIGNRLGYKWAGGEGFEKHASGFVGIEEFKRGETVSSGDEWTLLEFCNAKIWMDINTEIKLIDGRADNCQINILQGRTVITGETTVLTRELKTIITGTTSFVHYSWLDEIEVANLDEESIIYIPDQEPIMLNKQAVRLTTLPNTELEYDYKHFNFNSTTSSASDFYANSIEFGF